MAVQSTTQPNNRRRPPPLQDWRCSCGHLLFRAELKAGTKLETKCRQCGRIVVIHVPSSAVW